jgi:hypothetical protein
MRGPTGEVERRFVTFDPDSNAPLAECANGAHEGDDPDDPPSPDSSREDEDEHVAPTTLVRRFLSAGATS